MTDPAGTGTAPGEEHQRTALRTILEAWADAEAEGVDSDLIAHAALFAAFTELVSRYGEIAVADLAERLPMRVRSGEFTLPRSLQ